MRPQHAADAPSPAPPPSSPALLNRIDFFFLQGCERRLVALQGAENSHADGGHNNWSGIISSHLIRQTRQNYCTGKECQGNPWRSVSIKVLLDRCLSADWLITLTSPLYLLIFSFFPLQWRKNEDALEEKPSEKQAVKVFESVCCFFLNEGRRCYKRPVQK